MSVVAVASAAASNGIQDAVRNNAAGSESGQIPNTNGRDARKKNRRSKKSTSQKTPTASTGTLTTTQTQAPGSGEESPASRQTPLARNQIKQKTDKSVTCNICSRRFGDKAALRMHIRNAPGHLSEKKNTSQGSAIIISTATVATTATIAPSDAGRRGTTTPVNGSSSQRGKQGLASTKKAVVSKGDLHCAICNRNFVKENGLRMHVETSKEHKANLERQGSERQRPQATLGGAAYGVMLERQLTQPACQASTFDAFGFLERASESINTIEEVSATVKEPVQQTETKLSMLSGSGIQGGWSDISEDMHESILEIMRATCHPVDCLEKNGYVLRESTPQEMEAYWRCENCRERRKVIEKRNFEKCKFHPAKKEYEEKRNRPYRKQGPYPCCKTLERGCTILPLHSYLPPEDRILNKFSHYAPAPPSSAARRLPARPAVVLDCEMVEVNYTTSEAVRLCAVDFLTGSVLIDTYVMPHGKITDYRTRYSGVTPSMLSKMAMVGWAAARAELYKFIDESTILIGQSLNHDLDVLRVVHFNIIDTAIITQMAVGPECTRRWGLKALCSAFLDREIQNKKTGHDCLEDVFATREVLLWCLRSPEKLAVWADTERETIRKKKEEEEAKRAADKKKKEEEKAKKAVEENKNEE